MRTRDMSLLSLLLHHHPYIIFAFNFSFLPYACVYACKLQKVDIIFFSNGLWYIQKAFSIVGPLFLHTYNYMCVISMVIYISLLIYELPRILRVYRPCGPCLANTHNEIYVCVSYVTTLAFYFIAVTIILIHVFTWFLFRCR